MDALATSVAYQGCTLLPTKNETEVRRFARISTDKIGTMIVRYPLAAAIGMVCILGMACGSGSAGPAARSESTAEEERAEDGSRLLAVLRPNPYPLWFELGASEPSLIDAPDAASLIPFAPWPHSRHVADMAFYGESLVLAINQVGVLLFLPRAEGVALYGMHREEWAPYTVAGIFQYRESPAALLYRDSFFLDAQESLPDLGQGLAPLWAVDAAPGVLGAPQLRPQLIAGLSPSLGWNLDAIRLGKDGFWYYREQRERGYQRETRYFRTADLAVSGEESSFGVFRNATVPYTIEEASPLLALVLESAREHGGSVATVISPAFPVARCFAEDADLHDDFVELSGFYRDSSEPIAALLFPTGSLLYAMGGEGIPQVFTGSLPPLPEGYVYTRLGSVALPAGHTLVAAWEEQDNWNIGAAGFMVITLPNNLD